MPRNFILRALRVALPETRYGDFVFSCVLFILQHRRIPRRNPAKWNDYLFWHKVSKQIEDPLRVFVSDKEYVKTYIKATLGDSYNIPTLKILRTAEEAVRADYPSACVIKPTQLSGPAIFRKTGRDPVDRDLIRSWFSRSHYRETRERNYATLAPKVIVEALVFGKPAARDIRFHCRDGKALLIYVSSYDPARPSRSYYDLGWKKQPFSTNEPFYRGPDRDMGILEKRPKKLKEMIRIAEALSRPFRSYIRIDMYSDDKAIKIGEITNLSGGAANQYFPEGAEERMYKFFF